MITDNYGRKIHYLRLAVTDRCNLRCTYCMPAAGLQWLPGKELMRYEEMLRLSRMLVKMGIDKIRITGGEPFVRKDLMPFLHQVAEISGLKELTITTNGLLTEKYVPGLKQLGVKAVNLSLDTLDPGRFRQIARRDGLNNVLATMYRLLEQGIDVKMNAVVMEGKNIEDIVPLVRLTKTLPVSVRFIEEMPFNGGHRPVPLQWDAGQILRYIKSYFPDLERMADPVHATACNYQIPGFTGSLGIIAGYTRSFCGSCNRIRITPAGVLRTCLYSNGGLDLKEAMRAGATDAEIEQQIINALLKKPENGWAAQDIPEAARIQYESMAAIGG
ncbi:MAG: GTP 3',8-cyclase MoaA [Niabella sp.]|nr:GTP 3',8-cyclase MoaA [Niabella sp.]